MTPDAVRVLLFLVLAALAVVGTVAARTHDPARQAVVLSVLGLLFALLFTVVQAPDVALSQLAVGSAVTPLLLMLTLRRLARERGPGEPTPDRDDGPDDDGTAGHGGGSGAAAEGSGSGGADDGCGG